jgi:hypothetical protein
VTKTNKERLKFAHAVVEYLGMSNPSDAALKAFMLNHGWVVTNPDVRMAALLIVAVELKDCIEEVSPHAAKRV